MIRAFCHWLAQTPVSLVIQNVTWIIPIVQSVHILAIATITVATAMLDLRLLRIVGRATPLADMQRGLAPWFWSALGLLTATGLVLVIGEPKRELINPVFLIKMVLVVLLAVMAVVIQHGFRAGGWETPVGRARMGKALGAGSILLLLAVITCGRWIAYALVDN